MAVEGERVNFNGKFRHVKSENFDDFLRENGAPWIARKIAVNTNPDIEIKHDGDKFTIKVTSVIFTKESNFTIGTEFEEKQQNGVIMKVMPEWDGNKLVLKYSPKDTTDQVKEQKTTREIKGNQLIMTLELGDIICTRIYEKTTE